MSNEAHIQAIAHIRTAFASKFGVPRQSGLAQTPATIIFTPAYRDPNALRGLEDYSHIWLIWQFSQSLTDSWSPTIRPPRLGGNVRMGVFATRSPNRPNSLGLSVVQLERVQLTGPQGPELHVLGADLVDGTPIFDIKPYVPYADSVPQATGGFTDRTAFPNLTVEFPPALLELLPEPQRSPLCQVLSQDPRPSYQSDPERVYGFVYAGYEIQFTVQEDVLRVLNVFFTSKPAKT